MDTKANNIGYASLRSYNYNPKITTNNDMVIKPSFSASAGYNTGYWKSNDVNTKQFETKKIKHYRQFNLETSFDTIYNYFLYKTTKKLI